MTDRNTHSQRTAAARASVSEQHDALTQIQLFLRNVSLKEGAQLQIPLMGFGRRFSYPF
tara:strand:+ start:106 stop:282 length:177 start_codon:yes stop_codon:yes gene_type:complete